MTERTLRAAAPGTAATGTAPRTVLIIVTAGVVLAGLDLFVVNVALPQIARDLGTANLGELSWVLHRLGAGPPILLVAAATAAAAGRPWPDHGRGARRVPTCPAGVRG